jgi:putative membrane protein
MMHDIYGGMGAGGWILMSVIWIALIALIVWAVVSVLPRGPRTTSDRELADSPEEILDRRLAAGDIDAQTYDELRGKLRAAHAARG